MTTDQRLMCNPAETKVKRRLERKEITDALILYWIEDNQPQIDKVRVATEHGIVDLVEISVFSVEGHALMGRWRRSNLRGCVRAALSGVRSD